MKIHIVFEKGKHNIEDAFHTKFGILQYALHEIYKGSLTLDEKEARVHLASKYQAKHLDSISYHVENGFLVLGFPATATVGKERLIQFSFLIPLWGRKRTAKSMYQYYQNHPLSLSDGLCRIDGLSEFPANQAILFNGRYEKGQNALVGSIEIPHMAYAWDM